MTIKQRLLLLAIGCVAFLVLSNIALAEYPDKPVKIFVGFAPGGGTDTTARGFASYVHEVPEMNGMPAVIVNKPGGSGMIAAKVAYEAAPDGYTLYMINATVLGINKLRGGKVDIHPLKEFQPLGCISQLVPSIVVSKDSPHQTASDVMKAAEDKKLRFAHTGNASVHTLAGMSLLKKLGIDAQGIPFKGGAKARAAVVANKVDFGFMGVHLTAGFENDIKTLAVFTKERDPVNPDVPVLGELGLPDIGLSGPMCLFGHSDLPADVVTKLRKVVADVASKDGFGKYMKKSKLAAFHISAEDAMTMAEKLMVDLKPVVEAIFAK